MLLRNIIPIVNWVRIYIHQNINSLKRKKKLGKINKRTKAEEIKYNGLRV